MNNFELLLPWRLENRVGCCEQDGVLLRVAGKIGRRIGGWVERFWYRVPYSARDGHGISYPEALMYLEAQCTCKGSRTVIRTHLEGS